MQDIQLVLNFI